MYRFNLYKSGYYSVPIIIIFIVFLFINVPIYYNLIVLNQYLYWKIFLFVK